VIKVNELLPDYVRVLGRTTLPTGGPTAFNAETECNQRRFEVLLPLSVLMPDSYYLNNAPSEPIIRTKQRHSASDFTSMDLKFPYDTDEGQTRIKFFRVLKAQLKKYAGIHNLHNFMTGGGCPDESISSRRIDKIYHKELLTLNDVPWVVLSLSGTIIFYF
jgi:tRNA U38,U39,U40 pseudouridine synthase TruA